VNRIIAAVVAALFIAVLSLWTLNAQLQDQLANSSMENRELRQSIKRSSDALTAYSAAKANDTKSLFTLDRKIKELEAYILAMPDGADQCLSPNDTDRLRQLWQ
jgi:Tfp pilus assembly protein PilO